MRICKVKMRNDDRQNKKEETRHSMLESELELELEFVFNAIKITKQNVIQIDGEI